MKVTGLRHRGRLNFAGLLARNGAPSEKRGGQTTWFARIELGPTPLRMDHLTIELDQLDLAPGIVNVLRDELLSGGIRTGTFCIGSIRRLPDTVYFLWRRSAEIPVSTTVPLAVMDHPALVQIAVQEFVMKWNQVID